MQLQMRGVPPAGSQQKLIKGMLQLHLQYATAAAVAAATSVLILQLPSSLQLPHLRVV
jgi:hypothetical protein